MPENGDSGNAPPKHRARQGDWRRPSRWAPVLAVLALAIAAVGVFRISTSNGKPDSAAPTIGRPPAGTSATSAARPSSSCRRAVAAADQLLNQSQQVEASFLGHAKVMDELERGIITTQAALVQGVPSLVNGARASARLDALVGPYQQAAPGCGGAEPSASCPMVLRNADAAFAHARMIEKALQDHTNIMVELDSGRISGAQATVQGQPSMDLGMNESGRFNNALARYQQAAPSCR